LTTLLTGVFIIHNLHASTSSLVTQGDSTQDAQDLRNQQQLQLESLIANAENDANRQRLDLQNQYAALQVQLAKCGTDRSIASIQAQKDAEDKKASGTQNMIQQGVGGVAHLDSRWTWPYQNGQRQGRTRDKRCRFCL
jgi:hypothetical protein